MNATSHKATLKRNNNDKLFAKIINMSKALMRCKKQNEMKKNEKYYQR